MTSLSTIGPITLYNFLISEIDECDSNPCQNAVKCVDRLNGYTCDCNSGFSGPNCESGEFILILVVLVISMFWIKCVSKSLSHSILITTESTSLYDHIMSTVLGAALDSGRELDSRATGRTIDPAPGACFMWQYISLI